MKTHIQRISIIASFLLLAGCADDYDNPVVPPEEEAPPLSKNFRVTGAAVGDDGELSIDCDCGLMIELTEEPDGSVGVEYEGLYGGDFRRTVLDKDGSGISLMPDVFGDVIVRVLSADSIELSFPANEGTGSRFWENIALFKGASTENDLWEGEWTCAPFDIFEGGWVDTAGIAVGNWRIELIQYTRLK